MKIPNADRAIVPREKLQDYLLSPTHPVGRFKAAFFGSIGYTQVDWEALEHQIRRLLDNEAVEGEETRYGKKYEVHGTITGLTGQEVSLVTVWVILAEEDVPRFVTAYPGD